VAARERHDVMTKNETKLELSTDQEIRISRTIDGPARIVFEAWTKPEFLKRWWAPKSRGVTLVGCEADLKVGGGYRYIMRRENGQEMAFSGQYKEFSPHSRLVYTNVFEPMRAMGEAVVTVTFDEDGERTHVTAVERYPSKEVRDGVLATGMEKGMRETLDQLEALVAVLR
jgi:uncharacterized protein YndB with AHSA1/START domain